jgi:hypothetical protein
VDVATPWRRPGKVFKREQRADVESPTITGMGILFVAGVLAVVGGLGVVAFMTWRNGAPTQSIAQVLHDVEHPVGAEATRPVSGRRR